MAIQQTYSMIKPDGVRNGHIGEIINRFERAGLTIERMELGMVTPEQAAANYAEHEGKPFYDGLIAYITSGPVVKMVVSGEGAVAKCRRERHPRLRQPRVRRARDRHLLRLGPSALTCPPRREVAQA